MYWDFEESVVNIAEESRKRSAIALTIAPNTTILDLTVFGFPFEVLLNAIGLYYIY